MARKKVIFLICFEDICDCVRVNHQHDVDDAFGEMGATNNCTRAHVLKYTIAKRSVANNICWCWPICKGLAMKNQAWSDNELAAARLLWVGAAASPFFAAAAAPTTQRSWASDVERREQKQIRVMPLSINKWTQIQDTEAENCFLCARGEHFFSICCAAARSLALGPWKIFLGIHERCCARETGREWFFLLWALTAGDKH